MTPASGQGFATRVTPVFNDLFNPGAAVGGTSYTRTTGGWISADIADSDGVSAGTTSCA